MVGSPSSPRFELSAWPLLLRSGGFSKAYSIFLKPDSFDPGRLLGWPIPARRGRVKGERGGEQARRRPTVSALSAEWTITRLSPLLVEPDVRFARIRLSDGFHPGMRRWLKMKAPELKHPLLPEDDVCGEAPRSARRDLLPPPQKVPHTVPDVAIDRPVGHEPGTVREVVRPSAHHTVEFRLHLVPCLPGRRICRCVLDPLLDQYRRFA